MPFTLETVMTWMVTNYELSSLVDVKEDLEEHSLEVEVVMAVVLIDSEIEEETVIEVLLREDPITGSSSHVSWFFLNALLK